MKSFFAPGKLMVLGEYAVLFGHHGLVTAIDKGITVSIAKGNSNAVRIDTKNFDTRFIKQSLAVFKSTFNVGLHNLVVTVRSDIGDGISGLGSSAAVVVATLGALGAYYDKTLSKKQLFDLSYKVIQSVQGNGSGADVAASVYGGIVYYAQGKKIEQLKDWKLPLVVGFSGQKGNTVELIEKMKTKYSAQSETILNLATDAHKGKKAFLEEDWETCGKLMNHSHQLLQQLGVSTQRLDRMVSAAFDAGAYGAKLSGAGGGDCMIALHPDGTAGKRLIEKAIKRVGGMIVKIKSP